MIHKGQKIYGPDGQGYEATRDLTVGTSMRSEDLKAFGGAPEPKNGTLMPGWLITALEQRFARD